jgi:glucan phosphorylase
VSLFYREGYFQQAIDANNWQTEYYTLLNPKNLPVEPVLNEKGEQSFARSKLGQHRGVPGLASQCGAGFRSISSIQIFRKTSNTFAT